MSNFGLQVFPTMPQYITTRAFAASDPAAMRDAMIAAATELAALPPVVIGTSYYYIPFDIQLVGAGDGHTFACQLSVAAAGGAQWVVPSVYAYAASDPESLQSAALAALAQAQADAAGAVYAWGMGGTSQGRRWMGMLFAGTSPTLNLGGGTGS